jgi:hypothetical protein
MAFQWHMTISFIQVRFNDEGFNQCITESDTLKVSNRDKQVINWWYPEAFLYPPNTSKHTRKYPKNCNHKHYFVTFEFSFEMHFYKWNYFCEFWRDLINFKLGLTICKTKLLNDRKL